MAIRKMVIAETEQERIDRLEKYNGDLNDKLKSEKDPTKIADLKKKIKENNDKMSSEKKDSDKAVAAVSIKDMIKEYNKLSGPINRLKKKDRSKAEDKEFDKLLKRYEELQKKIFTKDGVLRKD
jgi:hypothetical protein